MTQTLTGHCYCGEVSYEVRFGEGEGPMNSVYCHCESCRRAHAAPLYHVVFIEKAQFAVTEGSDRVVAFTRPNHSIARCFCGACGSKIYNTFATWRPGGKEVVAFFPDTLSGESQAFAREMLRPQDHNRAVECVLDRERIAQLWEPAP